MKDLHYLEGTLYLEEDTYCRGLCLIALMTDSY